MNKMSGKSSTKAVAGEEPEVEEPQVQLCGYGPAVTSDGAGAQPELKHPPSQSDCTPAVASDKQIKRNNIRKKKSVLANKDAVTTTVLKIDSPGAFNRIHAAIAAAAQPPASGSTKAFAQSSRSKGGKNPDTMAQGSKQALPSRHASERTATSRGSSSYQPTRQRGKRTKSDTRPAHSVPRVPAPAGAGAFAYYPDEESQQQSEMGFQHGYDMQTIDDDTITMFTTDSTNLAVYSENHSNQKGIVEASRVNDAEPVIVATSVDKDETVRNRRRLRISIGIAIICVVALVVGIAIWATQSADKKEGANIDLGDPRCLLQIEEQSIFAVCSCSGSAENYVLKDEELDFYEDNAAQMLSNKGLIEGPFDRDSCEPGNQALLWSSSFTRAGFSTPGVLLQFSGTGLLQMYTLAYTYLVLGGTDWARGSTSVEDTFDVCQWDYVSCSFLARVVELNLADNNLVGELPEELSHMPYLKHLDMARNPGLNGTIGEFKSSELYRSLKAMHLDFTSISGTIPSSLSMLTMLNQLDLANTRLTGSLPTSLGYIENLSYLMVNDNALTGTIPTDIGMLSNLQLLDLSSNRFSGTIPTQVEVLIVVELIDVRNNVGIHGTIPTALGNLPRLGTTFLSNTSLDMTSLPETFCNLTVRSRSYDVVVLNCTEGRPTCSCCESLVLCADAFPAGDATYLE